MMSSRSLRDSSRGNHLRLVPVGFERDASLLHHDRAILLPFVVRNSSPVATHVFLRCRLSSDVPCLSIRLVT